MPDSSEPLSSAAQKDARRLQNAILRFFLRLNLSEEHFLIGLAILVGLGSGFGAVYFRKVLDATTHIFLDRGLTWLGSRYLLPLLPAVGGLATGVLVYLYAPEAKGHGEPEVMKTIILKRSVIRPHVVIIKAITSVFTLGSGGSAGSEGPIVQIGGGWGSGIGQLFRLSESTTRTLLGCGAGAGISAIFDAPLGGMLFGLEIMLGDFTIASFTPVIISSVLAAMVTRAYFGPHPAFAVPTYSLGNVYELGWYVVLAALAGAAAVLFIKLLYFVEDFFETSITWMPEWIKPAVGGLIVGGFGIAYPQVLGVGYPITGKALQGEFLLSLLCIMLVLKLVATAITLGSGGSGGVFAPALYFGATLGGAFGVVAHNYLPGVVSPPGAFAVVGMGAMLAAELHAPLTGMFLIFEITGNYQIILPLMLTTILAVIVARALERESIYTLKLRRQGLRLLQGRDLGVLERVPVSRILRNDYDFVREHTPLGEIVDLVQHSNLHDFPVLDESGHFLGMIWFRDIREIMLEDDMYVLLIAEDVQGDPPPLLLPESSLADALMHFSTANSDTLPVFQSSSAKELAGVITRTGLMRAYERELFLRERAQMSGRLNPKIPV